MTSDAFGLPRLSAAPNGADLVVTVMCRVARKGRGSKHEITIHQDWSVTTPHDLGAERIGVAMGGYLSCLNLVDHDVPAVRAAVQRLARREPPLVIRPYGERQWSLRGRACGKCRSGWWTAAQAAEHSRGWPHMLLSGPAAATPVTAITHAVIQAHQEAGSFDPPPDRAGFADGGELVIDRRGATKLWDAGLHPDLARRIHEYVAPGGPPLPAAFYLDAVGNSTDLDWLIESWSARPDTGSAAWLAGTQTERDRQEPLLRRGFLALGLPRDVVLTLTDAGTSVGEVEELATCCTRSPGAAALTLAGWAKAACAISIEQLLTLRGLGVDEAFTPSLRAVDELMTATGYLRIRYSRVELGMLLAVAGNVANVRTLVRHGVRDPATAAARLRSSA